MQERPDLGGVLAAVADVAVEEEAVAGRGHTYLKEDPEQVRQLAMQVPHDDQVLHRSSTGSAGQGQVVHWAFFVLQAASTSPCSSASS